MKSLSFQWEFFKNGQCIFWNYRSTANHRSKGDDPLSPSHTGHHPQWLLYKNGQDLGTCYIAQTREIQMCLKGSFADTARSLDDNVNSTWYFLFDTLSIGDIRSYTLSVTLAQRVSTGDCFLKKAESRLIQVVDENVEEQTPSMTIANIS